MARILWLQFRVGLAIRLQYRAEALIWLIGAVLQPVIYLVVWNAVATVQGGSVGGFTAQDFAAYFLVQMVVNQITFTWIMWEYEYFIREGTLARRLMRPLHPIWIDVADNTAYKAFTMVALIPTVILLAIFFHPTFNTTWMDLMLGVPAVFLAAVLRFSFEWTLAMAAFWTTRIGAINQVYFVIFLFFSGQLAPLTLMPRFVQTLGMVLPFRWMLAFPLELLLGGLSPQEIALGFLAQTFWIALTVAVLLVVWRAGVKQFSAVGS